MYFNDRYSVTTTTSFSSLEEIIRCINFDLLVIDADPNQTIEDLCKKLKGTHLKIPIIITYVFKSKIKDLEDNLKKYTDAIFYKPIELPEVTKKINSLLN